MLILMRKTDQEIIVGREEAPEIVFRILGVTGDQVRIGITAPDCFNVHRREVFEKIQREKVNGVVHKKKPKEGNKK